MRFLLTALNAKYIHSNPAVYSLRRYAGKYSKYVQIAEYTINNSMEDILADIYGKQPDVIAFSCYIWNWNMIQDIIVELHKLLPELPIWLGGPEVSYGGESILMQYPQITGIMAGEGEETFAWLLQYYVNGGMELKDIAGLVLRDCITRQRKLLPMSEIPFLYDDLTDFTNRIIYYESQRGCPFECSYCLSSIDKTVRLRDINIVQKELQFFLDSRVKQVKFVDRTFNCNHRHAMAVWRYIHENDNGVTNFHFEIAGDIINEEELNILRRMRPGLVQLEIGVQSTNEKTLKEIRRFMDIEKLKLVTGAIRRAGNIHQHLDLIAGLPYEGYESFSHSFNEVYELKPNQLQLGFLKVLKGSYMHDMAEEYGIVYTKKPPYEVLYTKWLSYQELRRLKKIEEVLELYYNSNQFTHTLPVLEKAFTSPFAMYEALADYYEKEGYFKEAPSRIYRYQVLLSFAESYDNHYISFYKELLTFDLYLRENAKSRPDFACDLTPYKKEIALFYKREEENKTYLPDYSAYDSKQLARMTHLEPFTHPVWGVGHEPADGCKKGYILFDYKNRSPLTHEARYIVIEEEPQNEEEPQIEEEPLIEEG